MLPVVVLAASLASCHVDDARYSLRGAPEVSAQFRRVDSSIDWPSRLALAVSFAKTGHTYWFLPWSGGSDDLQHLASTTDVTAPGWHPPSPDAGPRPIGDVDYIAFSQTFDVVDAAPRRGDIAPAHLLLPNLGDKTWHASGDAAPTRLFDLLGC